LPFEDRLGLLVDCECTYRDNNRLQRRLKAARLQLPAAVEDLDLSPSRGIDRRLVLQLAKGEWIARHLNILILGPTGAGKTFLACALSHPACRRGFSVRYQRTSRLLHQTALSHADSSYPKLLDTLARVQLLALDDWLRDPLTRSQSQDLLEIVDDRYGRSSTMVVTQVPVAEWHARFPDGHWNTSPGRMHSSLELCECFRYLILLGSRSCYLLELKDIRRPVSSVHDCLRAGFPGCLIA
jgi:DNA replication protein DnaC